MQNAMPSPKKSTELISDSWPEKVRHISEFRVSQILASASQPPETKTLYWSGELLIPITSPLWSWNCWRERSSKKGGKR